MRRLVIAGFFLAVALVVLRGALTESRMWLSFSGDADFPVYYTAACLVHEHRDAHLYDRGHADSNPAYGDADPGTIFYQIALARGIQDVRRYIYPPTLADLMVPLTAFSPVTAQILWDLLNLVGLLYACVLLARIMGIRTLGPTVLVAASILLFRPTLNCFYYGQTGVFLFVLLVAGFSLYVRGKTGWAGLLFALAIAVKLTPLIILVPLLAWRDWKTLRAIALWCVGILGVLLVVNGPHTLALFALGVMPAMMHRVIDMTNITLDTALQVLWRGAIHGDSVPWVTWLSRMLSLLAVGYAGWLSLTQPRNTLPLAQVPAVFAVFLLISCCIAPISWRHAYVLAAPALAILAQRIWQGRSSLYQMALALAFLMELSSVKLIALAKTAETPIFAYLGSMTPIFGLLLAIAMLHSLRKERIAQVNEPLAAVAAI